MAHSFRELIVWQKAMDLAEWVYRETKAFPKEEEFGLKAQIRRSATSIPSNIAEGSARGTPKDFIQFLRIAKGSLRELETQIELSRRIGFIPAERCEVLQSHIDSVSKLLTKLIASQAGSN